MSASATGTTFLDEDFPSTILREPPAKKSKCSGVAEQIIASTCTPESRPPSKEAEEKMQRQWTMYRHPDTPSDAQSSREHRYPHELDPALQEIETWLGYNPLGAEVDSDVGQFLSRRESATHVSLPPSDNPSNSECSSGVEQIIASTCTPEGNPLSKTGKKYEWRIFTNEVRPNRKLSDNPIARRSRKCRLLKKQREMEAELNLGSQDVQKFIDQAGVDGMYFTPPNDQGKGESFHRTYKVGGKSMEVKLLSNTTSAQRHRTYKLQGAGNMKLPLSDHPAAQSRRERCQTHEVNGRLVKTLSDHPAAQRARDYRRRRKEAEARLALQRVSEAISKNDTGTEVNGGFGGLPPEPAFNTYAGLPSWDDFSGSAACSSNIDRR